MGNVLKPIRKEENPEQLMDRQIKELDAMVEKIYQADGRTGEIGTALLHVRGRMIKEYDRLKHRANNYEPGYTRFLSSV